MDGFITAVTACMSVKLNNQGVLLFIKYSFYMMNIE